MACVAHKDMPDQACGNGACAACLAQRNVELEQEVQLLKKRIHTLEDNKYESFVFFFCLLCQMNKNIIRRTQTIQERIVRGNNYNIQVRPGRPQPLISSIDSPRGQHALGATPYSDSETDDYNTDDDVLCIGSPKLSTQLLPTKLPPRQVIHEESDESSILKHFHHIVFDNALDPILIHGLDGHIVDANGACVVLTGYSLEELRSMNVRQLESRYVEPDPKIFEQLLTGASFKIYGEHVTKQGRVFPVEVHISLATVEGTQYVVGLFRDITETIRREALEKENAIEKVSNRAKAVFFSTMSHELRTPLYGIMGSLDLLSTQSVLSNKQQEYIDCAIKSVYILKSIINDTMDLSALELGDCRLRKAPFSLLAELNYVSMLVKQAAATRGLSLDWYHEHRRVKGSSYKTDFEPVRIVGDANRLDQVLLNLLSNAVKFTPSGGKIILETAVLASDEKSVKLQLVVKDNGIGISRNQQHRLFRMFTQVDEGFKRKYGGTGSGLYIAQRLIHLMGGRITVRSEEGYGSDFRVLVRIPKYQGTVVDDDEIKVDHGDHMTIPGFLMENLSAVDILSLLMNGTITEKDQERELEARRALVEREASKKLKPPSLKKARSSLSVLLAEDNAVNQQVGVKLLRTLGVKDIEVATDGVECIAKIKNRLTVCRQQNNNHGCNENSLKNNENNDNNNNNNDNNNQSNSDNSDNNSGRTSAPTTPTQTRSSSSRAKMYDIILMDKQMPNMDGIEATKEIRRLEAELGLQRVLVVALTADCRAGSDVELMSSGMDDVLNKPIRVEGLRAAFKKYGLID